MKSISAVLRFIFLVFLKLISKCFFHFETDWINGKPTTYKNKRLFLLLNHTSLLEPIYLGAFPLSLLWQIANRFTYPVAEKTLRRPVFGRFLKALSPVTLPLTRKRDKSWDKFVTTVKSTDCFIGFAPEGRMKRSNGLDSDGKPMTMKGGVVDLLENLDDGEVLFLYSGGLHHIQAPGEKVPRIFKRVYLAMEALDLKEYKAQILSQNPDDFRKAVITDLEKRRDERCPHVIDMRKGLILRFFNQLIYMWT